MSHSLSIFGQIDKLDKGMCDYFNWNTICMCRLSLLNNVKGAVFCSFKINQYSISDYLLQNPHYASFFGHFFGKLNHYIKR